MNTGVHVYFWISIFVFYQLYTQEWNCWVHTVVLFLVFWEICILFSTVAASVCIPPEYMRVPFFHILATVCYLCSFWWCSFLLMWHAISLWFWFAFPLWLVILRSFHVPLAHLHFFFGKISIQVICPFLNWVFWFFDVELHELFLFAGY